MSMQHDLFGMQGQLVLVTGASSGLGEHFATLLAKHGATVVLAARNTAKLNDLVQRIHQGGGKAVAVAMDVSEASSVQHAFEQMETLVGVPNVIVNNAGQSIVKPVLQHSEADYDQILNTNLKGVWLVATEGARRMVAAGKAGSIVNIASILGERVAGGIAPYAISKAGVLQATKALALELARNNIRVNALMPGYVSTNINRDFLQSELGEKLRNRIPSRQFCSLSDLDGPLLLLASPASAGMTGACIPVDRGHLVSGL
ncbi:SDR family NAD(P)-dependent oxidoreductase [Limnobacter sp.]|uniref:SDR family NAD(P)-dependent oxidoreductase n=1 Tax=Limnobacter sp. TaxID=2003368 RepID=UPI003510FF2F